MAVYCVGDVQGCDAPLGRLLAEIDFSPSRDTAYLRFEYDPAHPEQKTFVINEMIGIFDQLYDMKATGGPMFEQYFRNSAFLVMDHPESGNTLLEIGRVLGDKAFREFVDLGLVAEHDYQVFGAQAGGSGLRVGLFEVEDDDLGALRRHHAGGGKT